MAEEPIEAVIDEVIIQPDKIQPIIVNFQNGALKNEETNKMNCGLYHDPKTNKTILAMSNGQVVYKGNRPDTEKELTYTMLAIHNKRTGKIRLIQAERWQVAPVLDQQVNVDDEADAANKLSMLNKQFGSKKVKRRTEQYERMQINVDFVKEHLENTVSNVEIDRADLSTKSIEDDTMSNDNLPKCNRDATDVAEVYKLYDIVPKDVLKSLHDKVDEILENNMEGHSEFYIKVLKSIMTDSKRKKKIAMLEYMEAIAKWLLMPIREAKNRGLELCPLSPQISTHVLDTFSMLSANGRQRPNSMRDKGILHSMILALMLCNFRLDLELFSTLFPSRIGIKKFTHLARVIGAVPLKDNNKVFILKVPLPAPLSLTRKGRRK